MLTVLETALVRPDVQALKILSPSKAVESFPNGTISSPVLPHFLPSFAPLGPVNLVLESNLTAFNACVLYTPPTGSTLRIVILFHQNFTLCVEPNPPKNEFVPILRPAFSVALNSTFVLIMSGPSNVKTCSCP